MCSLAFGDTAAGNNLAHHIANVITAFEKNTGEIIVDSDLAIAGIIKNMLNVMGEGHHIIQPEKPGRSLDGMGGPEHGIQGVGRLVALFNPQQRLLHFLQQFTGFHGKGIECLFHYPASC